MSCFKVNSMALKGVPGNFSQNMPSFSDVELLNSWPKIDLVWIIDFLYPKSILLNYWQLTRMHLMSTRARSSSKLQSVHSRVLDVQFSSDQDHSTWNSILNTVYVLKFLYRHFFSVHGNTKCSRSEGIDQDSGRNSTVSPWTVLTLSQCLSLASRWPSGSIKTFSFFIEPDFSLIFFLFFKLFVNCSE